MHVLPEHLGHDEDASLVGHVEALAVLVEVHADRHAFGDAAVLVDDAIAHHGRRADFGVGQDHRVLDRAVVVHAYVGEQERAPHGRAAHDAAAGDDRIHRGAAAAIVGEEE